MNKALLQKGKEEGKIFTPHLTFIEKNSLLLYPLALLQ